ncbi:Isoamyl alcohol [Colletotrichum higginsianum IMI 349063]|uniref:Isoamyl alcohol n=3 Tax=Colletotrichum higginsianum TaxID=80884 RepID=A0A1B7YL32_COLHI|nr:Isoamyl alcohol [Colletotrichum higginsianum IMI 349063]OBR12725.1 Isoamyl alcohol [Colletotrichum higginsianum IMI 349063]TID00240.1 hypothetical protein CH35J_005190 [Colletotrichum higginsianum]
MVRSSLAGRLLAGALLLASGVAAHAEGCSCSSDGVKRVTYIVVEMPDQSEQAAAVATTLSTSTLTTSLSKPTATDTYTAQAAHVIEDIPAFEALAVKPEPEKLRPAANATHTFGPSTAPGVDTKDPVNIVPAVNVSLHYSAATKAAKTDTADHANADAEIETEEEEQQQQGSIDMTLAFKNPAVVLEHVDAVSAVVCSDDGLAVSFSDADAFREAVKDWSESSTDGGFVLITNHLGNCDAEFERGFFLATGLTSDEGSLSVTVAASREELANIAGECEMTFSSLPAATLSKRLTLDSSVSLSFAEALADDTVLFSDGQYVNVTADEAWFSSTVAFSGYLKYNFWGFRLEALYFDLDTTFDSAVGVSVDVAAAYSHSLKYAPDELAYSLVSVPGIVQLGPGVAFAVGLDFDVSAAVGVSAGLSVALPAANVHLDLVDGARSSATGWEPKYSSHANITESADVRVDASADVTVRLAFELLGGLVDLSAGITATPGFDNRFKLRGEQNLGLAGNFTSKPTEAVAEVPKDGPVCAEKNGVELATDFYFNLTGFATKWWTGELYSTRVPLWDVCYSF